MKRGKPLQRGKPLRTDPAKAKEWANRRRAPLAAGLRRRKATIPPSTRSAVLDRQGTLCVVPGCTRYPHTLHHIFPQQRWPEVDQDPANMVAICWADHDDHERANRRIARAWLPPAAEALAVRLGPPAVEYLGRTYSA